MKNKKYKANKKYAHGKRQLAVKSAPSKPAEEAGGRVNDAEKPDDAAQKVSAADDRPTRQFNLFRCLRRNSPVVVATFTVLLFGVAALQVCIYRKQELLGRIQERAWMSGAMQHLDAVQITVGEPIKTTVIVQNIGKTPATDVKMDGVVRVVEKSTRVDFTYSFGTHASVGAAFPGEPTAIPIISRSASLQEYEELQAQKAFVIFYFQITYSDRFKVEHWIHKCDFRGVSDQQIAQDEVPAARQCSDYNRVDGND